MKTLTLTASLIASACAATPLLAEDLNTGLQQIAIADPQGQRPLDGFLFYPTKDTDTTPSLGNPVWASLPIVADAATLPQRHPLVLMSHGMFGNARNQAWLAAQLTQQGYMVAAINHPGTTTFNRDPDQRRMLWERPKDISRALTHLLRDPATMELIDPDRIYMAGHSLGGFTAVALAGGRYDAAGLDAFCAASTDDLVCGIFQGWQVAQTNADRAMMEQDLSDNRIKAFAVFDLGGTQTFDAQSLGAIDTPLLVYGAPIANSGIDLDVESRDLITKTPPALTTYLEPADLAHFDFLGQCTAKGLAILREEEPQDAFVCENGTEPRAAHHAQIAQTVSAFFAGH
ncbi:alpha/beta hydrolase family protein [Algirhabdus cladophorae]|uniref:alpha/beta hydrolase family protein n=1 Tax=Algirhabdus cladophorae TaxID=3377108 RepID=UPI003B8486A2